MALVFSFHVGGNTSPDDLRSLLNEFGKASPEPDVETAGDLEGYTLSIYATDRERRSFLWEELEIAVHVTMRFRFDSQLLDLHPPQSAMLHKCLFVLRNVQGDAVFLYNGEQIWLLRQNGQLILNRAENIWSPEYLALVKCDYVWKDFPIL